MCMTKAYLDAGGERELLLEDVSRIEIDGPRVRVETLFGETRELEAQIKEIDFQSGSVIFASAG